MTMYFETMDDELKIYVPIPENENNDGLYKIAVRGVRTSKLFKENFAILTAEHGYREVISLPKNDDCSEAFMIEDGDFHAEVDVRLDEDGIMVITVSYET